MIEIIKKPMSNKVKDITDQRFGKLVAKEYIGSNIKGDAYWKCLCDCTNIVIVEGRCLRSGNTKSCGCLHDEQFAEIVKRQKEYRASLPPKPPKEKSLRLHGLTNSRIWRIWSSMKNRCTPTHKTRTKYVNDGITVCKEWQQFIPFYNWAIKNGYDDNLSIDRIDPKGNYCPENCRWVDRKVQSNNRTDNHYILLNLGLKEFVYTVTEWSEISGIAAATILRRLQREWNEFDAIFTPIRCEPGEKIIIPVITEEMQKLNHLDYFNSVGRVNHLQPAKNTNRGYKKKKNKMPPEASDYEG